MQTAIEILKPGLASTIQDAGRWGYQAFGVPVSGAVDDFSLQLANLLVGNSPEKAGIEFMLLGPAIKFHCPTFIAITGGSCQPALNQKQIELNRAYQVAAGDVLTFKPMKQGRFGYLAVAGGIKTPAILASRSTTSRLQLGGLKGKLLADGDFLPLQPTYQLASLQCRHCDLPVQTPTKELQLRFIKGPQWASFSTAAQEMFCQQQFQISTQADRMGYRLSGSKLPIPANSMLSEGTVTGNVQITRSGQPIVLLADRQTAGGYPVIGTICAVDLPLLVQAGMKQRLRFQEVSVVDATKLLRQRIQFLQQLAATFQRQRYQLPIGPQQIAGQRIAQLFEA